MPVPEKTKKPKKLDKGKKGELPKKAKKGSGNLLIILSVVGVVVLLAVGITIFMLSGGSNESAKTNPSGVNLNRGAQQSGKTDDGAAGGAPAVDVGELTAKMNDMIDKLADPAKSEESGKQLKELLESDQLNKAGGKNLVLNALKDKALGGNDGAKQFLLKLSKDSSNAALAQQAKKMYEDNLKQPGDKDTAMDAEMGDDPTNFLPNKVDVVFNIRMNKFIDSEFNKGVFATGAFGRADIDKSLGMPANTVDQFVMGGMKDFNQVVGIIRTTTPYNWDDVKKTMHLEESGNTIKGKTYYLGKIDFLTELLGPRIPGIETLRTKAAFWRADVKTLVYADETTMKDLLENPPEKDKTVIPPVAASLPGEGSTPPAQAGTGAGAADGPVGLGVSGGGGSTNKGAGAAVGAGNSGEAVAKKAPDPAKPERFSTIDVRMRRLINLTEDQKLESLVLFADKTTSKVPVLVNYVTYLDRLSSVRSREIDTLAIALPSATGSPSLRLGVACKSRATVRDVSSDVEKLLTKVGKEDLHDLFGFDFKLSHGSALADNQGDGGGPSSVGGKGGSLFNDSGSGGGLSLGGGGGRPRGGAGLGVGAGDGPATGSSGPGGGDAGRSLPGTGGGGAGMSLPGTGGGGAGMSLPGTPGGVGGGQLGKGSGGNQNNQAADAPAAEEPGGNITLERSEEYIIITATVKSSLSDFINKHMISWMQQLRGNQEMASGRFRFGDLTASLDYYKTDLTKNNRPITFPQGAYPRTFDAERGSRPFPAKERISFMRELLPYLGDDRYFGMERMIDVEKSWRDPHNLNYARIVVPHFLNPAAGSGSAYVKVRDVDQPLAVTHFVGMAGVGPDAASYPKSDPRAGIFGYDRVTTLDDVKDGLSNTIYMIEADKALLGPWLQGGGATVRGTSLEGNDVGRRGGFSSPAYSGKQGVWVMMADGSARFLTKDVSPEVFKALCTMAGSDSAGAVDLIAGKVNLEVTPRTEQASAVSTAKKKRVVEEEEVPVKK